MESQPIYKLRPTEVYQALETSPSGIPASEVASRQALYGLNILYEEKGFSPWTRLLKHISHPMALILWGAGILAIIVGEPVLGTVIWTLVLVNAGFSFWREYRAEQAMQELRKLLPAYARVVRDSNQTMLPASEVVPGDVLVLAEGDNIAADARVIEAFGLRTSNATLTGEAIPAHKVSDASFREGLSELERPNLIFAGTSVVAGTGRAVVYATGMLTQFGRIAHLTQTVKEEITPLQAELARLTRRISFIAAGIGAIVFFVGSSEVGLGLVESFLLAMGILVAAVPEGLPATITLTLALAAQRLAQKNVLVRKLAAIETLGTVSVICTDKSGTLTQNQMTVREIWISRQNITVSGVGYEPVGAFTPNPIGQSFSNDFKLLMTAAMLCNNSRLSPPTPERPKWTSLGDQTEAALRVAALKAGIDEHQISRHYPRIHELPFEARRKRMSTIHSISRGSSLSGFLNADPDRTTSSPEVAFIKGAPREVLQLCTRVRINEMDYPLTNTISEEIIQTNDRYANQALRVIALAMHELPKQIGTYTTDKVEREMTFLGLMAMYDPPRPEVADAIRMMHQAGIRMVMVTGDYGLTAESLARRIGMLTTPDPLIITGSEIDEKSDQDLQNILNQETVFARMAPEHKVRLVAALQNSGEVVAVTGDGVNDAPALRKADIGVVMGITGTDVAKEAGDIILSKDNFATIVDAIEEGRAIYDNLRKSITYIFSSNVPEILPFLLTALFNIPLALTVSQILAIDLGTDMLPSLALGMDKPEPDIMRRPPRRKNQLLVDRGMLFRAFIWLGLIEAALCYSGFFLIYAHSNPGLFATLLRWFPFLKPIPSEQAYYLAVTAYLAGVVTAQVGNAFACRTEVTRGRSLGWFSNRFLLFSVGAELVLVIVLIYLPFVSHAFNNQPIPLVLWGWLILYAPLVYGLEEMRKSVIRWLYRVRRNHIQSTKEAL